MKKYLIYYHKSPDNKYYIGQTCQEKENRWKGGSGYNSLKFNKDVISFYGGWESFEHGILEEDIDEKDIDQKEEYYISLFDSVNNGFNTYKKNYSGYHFADLWAQEETKTKIIEKLKQQRNTIEYKDQKSKQMKELWKTIEYQESIKKSFTEERREKISKNSKKMWENDPYREKISNAQKVIKKNQWAEPNSIYKQAVCKKVICLETNEIFESVKAAADVAGVRSNTMCIALRSKTHCSGAKKLHWMYLNEFNGKEAES